MDVDNQLEQLMGYLGEFGAYQRRQFLLHLLTALTAGMHMLSLVTVSATPNHRCLVPGEDANNTFAWNSSEVLKWVPMSADNISLESCLVRSADGNGTVSCQSWVYDPTYHPSSRVIEWDMVCDGRWMKALSQSAYMLGVFTGAVTLGSLADNIGRKKVLYASCVLQLIFGVLVAFVPEYYTFLFLRYLFGIFGSAGAYNTAFVLTMELVGASKRSACGLSFQFTFAVGMIMVAFWAWLIPDRFILQLIYGSHSLLLLGHWWLVDESPRWLWVHGKQEEAISIVRKGLKINGTDSHFDIHAFKSQTQPMMTRVTSQDEPQPGLLSLFKMPNLRNRTFNVGLNWFANSLAYYGLSLNTGSLPGNPFLMLTLSAAVELPSYVVTTYLMDKLGRRSVISTFMIAGGLACIISAYLPQSDESGKMALIGFILLAKLLIAGSFAIICNYTAELFPTVVRNTAFGIGSMCARLSGTLCPLITLLDSLDKTLPVVIFALVAVISGLLTLLLPETLNQPMAQSLEDGERFGEGDTAFSACFKSRRERNHQVPLTTLQR